MNEKWIVDLSDSERNELLSITNSGRWGARMIKRARILLLSDQGLDNPAVCAAADVGASTVYRTRRKFVEGGLQHALRERSRRCGRRKTSPEQDAVLIALACTNPPPGCARWTLRLLAGKWVESTDLDSVSEDTVGRRLAENDLKPWQKKMWCIPNMDAEFVARMEDVLDLYTGPASTDDPVVSFDETPVQLIAETRVPIPAKPGKRARIDYEYRRNGVANLFVFVDAHRSWRHVKVTERRTKLDFAHCMKDLVDEHYPEANRIRVVLDNLSTHRAAALYEAFQPDEARRILRRIEFHYTPKHASWLNMVEIEIGVLSRQCLARRIGTFEELAREVAAWKVMRDESGARIRWMFDVDAARQKMGRSYPKLRSAQTVKKAA